ncbi:MAG TPA: helix-turn-helix domain-containing protein [Stellaceae bacterium]|jgi:excisionase family DNA binding protein|nr:helix-turn-helix domain-containing protein [Stellaceae bacterium]
MDEVLTVKEVCRKLHIVRETLRRWERDGWFPKRIRFSRAARGRVGFFKADVERWIEARRNSAA